MKIFLCEDHDEVLKIWQSENVSGLDLIHIDAHFDFVIHKAKDPLDALHQAGTLAELRKDLEYTLCYLQYTGNISKQTDIGNYIYPAIVKNIVKDVWWVIPGSDKDFSKYFKIIQNIFCTAFNDKKLKLMTKNVGMAYCDMLGRRFWVTTLDRLPVFNKPVLLDIDADFMVIKNISCANNTDDIAMRRLEMAPGDLYHYLKTKVENPFVITIAYSTNGGYTPMPLRYIADELAYCFNRKKFLFRYKRAKAAAAYFSRFSADNNKNDYWHAAAIDDSYRAEDNNYGPLYMMKNNIVLARRELQKILHVDKVNPGALKNMAAIHIRHKQYIKALNLCEKILKDNSLSPVLKSDISLIAGEAAFRLKKYSDAKSYFDNRLLFTPLCAVTCNFLAQTYEKEKKYKIAAQYYKRAMQIAKADKWLIARLKALTLKLEKEEKEAIMIFIKRLKKHDK